MSKKRPGVEAAVRLSKIADDTTVWEQVEAQADDTVISQIPGLSKWNAICTKLQNQFASSSPSKTKDFISKQELMDIVEWKFSVGKKRGALYKLLRSNSDEEVKSCSQKAIEIAGSIPSTKMLFSEIEQAIETSINHLTQLKGVGPATASAVLVLVRPDIFCYMYDEAIDCFLPKRTYTLPIYMEVCKQCHALSKTLGGDGEWSPSRVGRVLWVAARVLAYGGDDQTKKASSKKKAETSERPKKRRKS